MLLARIPKTFVNAVVPLKIGHGELFVLAVVLLAILYFFGPWNRGR
jgi:hypothetical protein